MKAIDAVTLDNFFPTAADVMLRKGFADHATGLGDMVESLLVYNASSGSKMFGVADDSIFNVTVAGAVGAADVTGLTNARFEPLNISTAGGDFLLAVNGADKLQGYDGSAWWVDGDGDHDITGVDTATWIQLCLFMHRVWGVQKNSLKVWYLGTDAIAGAATAFSLQSVARRGGHLVAMGSWTLDGGNGMNDHGVFVTSEGEVIVYEGIDPANSDTWKLVGVYYLGAPIGMRCLAQYGADLLLITVNGVFPLSRALIAGGKPEDAITDKIRRAMRDAAYLWGPNFGWQLLPFYRGDMLILNVPLNEDNNQQQYVMNLQNGSWGRFMGVPANCWATLNNKAYFGGDGAVCEFWEAFSDKSALIQGDVQQAYDYFGSSDLKHVTMMRPLFSANGTPSILASVNTDYAESPPAGTISFAPSAYGGWDSGLWDSSLWGGGLAVLQNWQAVGAIGKCFGLRMRVQSAGFEVHHQATDYVFERGGVI